MFQQQNREDFHQPNMDKKEKSEKQKRSQPNPTFPHATSLIRQEPIFCRRSSDASPREVGLGKVSFSPLKRADLSHEGFSIRRWFYL